MRRSDLVQTETKGATPRTTQIVFGERQHLLRVLDSLETTQVPQVRLNQERRVIEELIHERTKELNHINSSWDEKVGLVLNADSKAEMLDKLVREAPESDYYLLRLISEHPKVPSKTLARLAKHPYAAIRENVAAIPTLTPPLWHGSLAIAASRFGTSWPSIPTPPPFCAANCKSACAS